MILIVGGSCQGKAAYARELAAGEWTRAGNLATKNSAENSSLTVADGTADHWTQALDCPYLLNFHAFIRQVMDAGENPIAFAEEICEKRPQIVTLDEVGCGIVPMEKAERDYREAVGHAGQLLAAAADEVYRMLCGVPVRIKPVR